MKNSLGSPIGFGGLRDARRPWWRRVERWLRKHKWPIILGFGLLALGLGYVGFAKLFALRGEERSRLDLLYISAQLFTLNSGSTPGPKSWEFEVARVLAPAVSFYAAVGALMAIFSEHFRAFRLWRMKNHVVLCGLGRRGAVLAKRLHESGEAVVVIERDEHNALIDQCREHGAIILTGDATDAEMLRRAGIHKASHLISLCAQDGTNAEVVAQARPLATRRKGRALSCFVHIADPALCSLLREREISTNTHQLTLEFASIYDIGAHALCKEYPPFTGTDAVPHLVVVDAGMMGQGLIVHAAREWWSRHRADGKRFRVTIVDREADLRAESLCVRYPRLLQTCQLIPQTMEVQSPQFERGEFLFNADGRCSATVIYVCFDDNSLALTVGLTLLRHTLNCGIPVIVRMTGEAGLATLLRGAEGGGDFGRLRVFPLLDRTCQPDLLLGGTYEILARAIHEDYGRGQEADHQTPETNPSMCAWDKLAEHLKQQNREQAAHTRAKLKAVGWHIAPLTDWDADRLAFTPDEVEVMAQIEHKRWMDSFLADRWRYAPGPKDPTRKTHPHLLPWDELDEDVKEIDRRTVRKLPEFLAKAGLEIYRLKAGTY